jgi:hypothetical protein
MESRVGNPLSTIQSRKIHQILPTSFPFFITTHFWNYSSFSIGFLGLQTLRSERELVESEITSLFLEKNAIQKVQNLGRKYSLFLLSTRKSHLSVRSSQRSSTS